MIAEMGFFKNNYGFCASKIKVSVNSASYYGQTVTARKDGVVIGTAVIGTNGKAEIVTDEAGSISLAILGVSRQPSTTVTITYYGTYYATIN